MKKLLNSIRNRWIKAQLQASPFVQRTVLPRLHETKEIARFLTKPSAPVYQLQGQGHEGGQLTVTYIGPGYAKVFLQSILFTEKPKEQKTGRIPFWRYTKLIDTGSSDIIIVEAAKHLIRRLPDQNAIVFPQHVDHILDVRGTWEDVRSRFRKNTRHYELRLIRKYGYEYDLSYDRQDFEEFYHQMYLPTTKERHGERSRSASMKEAYQYFRYGWLFRVKREGEWVAGMICHPQQKTLSLDIMGVRNGDAQLVEEAALGAACYASIEWANQNGCHEVNFLGSGPYIKGGLFQHKRKWGTTVSISPHLHRLIWLRVQRMTPTVAQFLKDTPIVTVGKDGQLHGLVVVDDPHSTPAEIKQEWATRYTTPGLSSLLVRSVGSFAEEPAQVNKSDLIIPISVTSK